jgi:hypothetical protein
MVIIVRPWKAPEKATMSVRPVAARAIFTAFSTASAPVENRIVFAGPLNGASAFSFSQSSI